MPRISDLAQYSEEELKKTAFQLLEQRGVTLNDIAELVEFLQKDHFNGISREISIHNIMRVLQKREIQNALITGIQLDILAEQKKLISPIQEIIYRDESLYGVDETLALSIVNVYGSIGFTNFGYIDKLKPGILQKLNDPNSNEVHTFLDDLVGAIAAAASSRLAHDLARR